MSYPYHADNEHWLADELAKRDEKIDAVQRRALRGFKLRFGYVQSVDAYGGSVTVVFDGDDGVTGPWEIIDTYADVAAVGDYAVFGQLNDGGWLAIGSQNRGNPSTPYGQRTVELRTVAQPYMANGDAGGAGIMDWAPPRATRTSDGIVVLSGLITMSGWALPGAIGRLPVGFRPDARVQFGLENIDTAKSIDIRADGYIVTQGGWGGGYISLDGIAFPAAGVATWAAPNSYANGWASSGTNYGPPSFWLAPNGCVWGRGQVAGGSTATDNASILILPTSLYQTKFQNHMVTTSNGGYGGLGLLPSPSAASVNYKSGTSNGWLSLAGTWWETPTSTLVWTNATFKNSWTNNGAANLPPVGYTRLANGLVRLRGLAAAGTMGQAIFTLPVGFRPKYSLILDRMSNQAFGRLDIQANGDVVPQVGSNAWFSLDTAVFLAEA